jgi:hypothetical protein
MVKQNFIYNYPTILVKIYAENRLCYKNCTSDNETDYLYLVDDIDIEIKCMTNVMIGTNKFYIVDEFIDDNNDVINDNDKLCRVNKSTNNFINVLHNRDEKITITLPIGTNVMQSNGISINISSPLEVILPSKCKIKLSEGIKLQQHCSPLKIILCEDTDAIIIDQKRYDSELITAIRNNSTSMTKILLKYGANVHMDNDEPLKMACENGYVSIVKILLKYGANVHADDDQALILACENGHESVIDLLLKYNADIHINNDEPLKIACEYCHVDAVKLLINNGANVNADNNYPIRIASEYNYPEIVNILLKNGANRKFASDNSILISIFSWLGF